ncbi:hypothetical protein LHYA1_G002851 [Lachnellula hyalina]|uniref:ABM domain-containing protein n=1 Tax=Lachnellula hyalina TaxID=1316788 RepID=A0A8H8U1Z2_9HELO|nr:uncharacterized protein LHYA1_G002851 [Lachnellula hyalina]TVY28432.1 hypothetical protein LHYA1_G002851 [Lachnellula hyalina]
MSCPKFYVVARVTSRKGALPIWRERIASLVDVSASEKMGDSYYWGYSLDGDEDTIMGLEGYTHPVGFFMGHFETDVFKAQNKLIDRDELLATQQGLDSPDYDLHHYDEAGGWVKRADDPEKDSKTSHQAAFQFYSKPEDRDEVLQKLVAFADGLKETQGPTGPIQSALILKEVRVPTMATLWLRTEDFKAFQSSGPLPKLLEDLKPLTTELVLRQAQSWAGHLVIKP